MSTETMADDDLEALFDRIASERATGEAASAHANVDPSRINVDPSRIRAAAFGAAKKTRACLDNGAVTAHEGEDRLFMRVGQLTRALHDALRELGYDKKLASAAGSLPDARERLAYIASLTGRSADRVLGAVEQGQAVQQGVESRATGLAGRWKKLYARELSVEEFKLLAGETRDFLDAIPHASRDMNAHLHDIMMAQDFHDLSGQVIKKIVEVAQTLEASLVSLLLEARPDEPAKTESLSGPAMRAEERIDVVASQAQVDQLLESLGF